MSLPLSNSFTVFNVSTHTSFEAKPTEKPFHRLTQKLSKQVDNDPGLCYMRGIRIHTKLPVLALLLEKRNSCAQAAASCSMATGL